MTPCMSPTRVTNHIVVIGSFCLLMYCSSHVVNSAICKCIWGDTLCIVCVVVQFLPLVQFFLNQYTIFEPVQNFWTSTKYFELVQFFFVFVFGFASNKKKIVLAPSIFILPLLFISTLLTSLTIPSLLSQHPSLYFYLNAYLVSLEPQTFGFPLDSCPDALPLSHEDLDGSSPIFLITYTQ